MRRLGHANSRIILRNGFWSSRNIFKRFSRNLLAKTEFNGYNTAMKSKLSFANVLVMLVFGCAIFISAIAQGGSYLHYSHVPPGRLIIDRAANFGWNLGFNLQIDGRSVSNVVQGRNYSAWLPPGPHVLTVEQVPSRGYSAPTSITV